MHPSHRITEFQLEAIQIMAWTDVGGGGNLEYGTSNPFRLWHRRHVESHAVRARRARGRLDWLDRTGGDVCVEALLSISVRFQNRIGV